MKSTLTLSEDKTSENYIIIIMSLISISEVGGKTCHTQVLARSQVRLNIHWKCPWQIAAKLIIFSLSDSNLKQYEQF